MMNVITVEFYLYLRMRFQISVNQRNQCALFYAKNDKILL